MAFTNGLAQLQSHAWHTHRSLSPLNRYFKINHSYHACLELRMVKATVALEFAWSNTVIIILQTNMQTYRVSLLHNIISDTKQVV